MVGLAEISASFSYSSTYKQLFPLRTHLAEISVSLQWSLFYYILLHLTLLQTCFLVSALMSCAVTVNAVHAAVTGAFATTAKGLLQNALRGGTLQKLEPALYDIVEGCRHREIAPTMVHDIFVTVPCPILPSVSYGPPIL